MHIIEPVKDSVIFTFVEEVYNNRFVNKTSGPIVVTSDDLAQTNSPRWGKVVEVGPDVQSVQKGEYILIDAGKWTNHFYVDGKRYWKTDDSHLMAVSDTPGTTY